MGSRLMYISGAFTFPTEFVASLKEIDRKRSRYCQDKHLTYTPPFPIRSKKKIYLKQKV